MMEFFPLAMALGFAFVFVPLCERWAVCLPTHGTVCPWLALLSRPRRSRGKKKQNKKSQKHGKKVKLKG
jgi:hypothetical protein